MLTVIIRRERHSSQGIPQSWLQHAVVVAVGRALVHQRRTFHGDEAILEATWLERELEQTIGARLPELAVRLDRGDVVVAPPPGSHDERADATWIGVALRVLGPESF